MKKDELFGEIVYEDLWIVTTEITRFGKKPKNTFEYLWRREWGNYSEPTGCFFAIQSENAYNDLNTRRKVILEENIEQKTVTTILD